MDEDTRVAMFMPEVVAGSDFLVTMRRTPARMPGASSRVRKQEEGQARRRSAPAMPWPDMTAVMYSAGSWAPMANAELFRMDEVMPEKATQHAEGRSHARRWYQ